jgi:hypothetical protein
MSFALNTAETWEDFVMTTSVGATSGATVDYSSGNFTQASFYARATVPGNYGFGALIDTSADAGAAAIAPANVVALDQSWQKFTVPVGTNLHAVEVMFILETVSVSTPFSQTSYVVYVDKLTFQ